MPSKLRNNIASTLLNAIGPGDLSMILAAGEGVLWDDCAAPNYAYTTLTNPAGTIVEVVKVTARSGDTLTIARAQDGTTAKTWAAGTIAERRLNALAVTELEMADGGVTTTAKLANRIVTFAKMAAINTAKLLGRSTAGSGDIEEIAIGTGLQLASGTLSCTVTSPVSSVGGYTGAVTNSQIAASANAGNGYAPATQACFSGAYVTLDGAVYNLHLQRQYGGEVVVSTGQYVGGICLHPHTVVRTPLGDKFICDIRPGDSVLTPEGFVEVLGSWESVLGNRDLVSINGKTVCTPGHLFPLALGGMAAVSVEDYEEFDKGIQRPVKLTTGMAMVTTPDLDDVHGLTVGSILIGREGSELVNSIEYFAASQPYLPVYSLVLDECHAFFADGIAVSTMD